MLKTTRICSLLLVLAMTFNLLPMQALGITTDSIGTASDDDAVTPAPSVQKSAEPAVVVEEIVASRTEYSKSYRLSNGLNMAVVYGEPVHYDENGQWAEIDNTLKASLDGMYTNTAGVWEVALPQQMTANSPVTITKDGYTLSFVLDGQLNKPSGTVVMSEQAELSASDASQTFTVAAVQAATAQVQDLGIAEAKATAEYPETVADKLTSRVLYENIYDATNITYDLDSNKVKESIIIEAYNADLSGYKYTLNVGDLIPVACEDGRIDFYNADKTEIIMTMPAPFLVDGANEYNYDVRVQLAGKDDTYILTYLLPQSWLADENRQWPVILDPVVQPALTTSNIRDRTVNENGDEPYNGQTLEAGRDPTDGIERFYLKYQNLPALSPSDVVLYAQIRLKVCGGYSAPKVEVHKVLGTWESETVSWGNKPDYDPIVEDYSTLASNTQWHQWTVTDIVRGWYEGQNTGMLFKACDEVEINTARKWRQYISSDGGGSSDRPSLTILFRNNNGLESYWDYTSASAGRAGTGSVNDYTGNLVWVHGDMGFGGNRAPVSVYHVYNANDTVIANTANNSMATGGNTFGMGHGWRTNYNQVVYKWSIDSNYYVWEDADGTDHYFRYNSSKGAYFDEDNLNLKLIVGSNNQCTITDEQGNASYFDSQGRLYKSENNQTVKSAVQIVYTSAAGKQIDYILDGVNRKYDFTYNEAGMLTRIGYYGSGTTELAWVTYAYDAGNNLVSITDKDGKTASYTYKTGSHLLASAQDIDGYKLTFDYTKTEAGKPSRVKSIAESYNDKPGSSLTIAYAHNQTTFTDHNGNTQISQFNDFGNTVSVQDGLGRAQYAEYANMTLDDNDKANQLMRSSKLQNTVKNYFNDPSFESGTPWEDGTISTAFAYMGDRSMYVESNAYIHMLQLAPNESVTFSGYVKTTNGTVQLNISDDVGDYPGPGIAANTDWTRFEVNYTNTKTTTQQVSAEILTYGESGAYIDCIQFEKTPTSSRYNLMDNGDFSNGMTGWTGSYSRISDTSAAPQLDGSVVTVTGDPAAEKQLTQTVKVSGDEGDCFVLAGWAKGDSVPLFNKRTFGIIGTFHYTDGTTKDFTASFNPDTRMTGEDQDVIPWQYTATPMVAEKAYSSITVKLAYDYNANTASFDGIQLFKEVFGQSFTYNADGKVVTSTDLQEEITSYEYNANGDLTKVILSSGAEMTYTYDSRHNVTTATSTEGLCYAFGYDDYGNNTEVSTTSNGLTMSAEVTYTADGNYQASATDALGNTTTYSYDPQTGVLEWVKGPTDTDATRTEYTYDAMFRTATAAMTTDKGAAMYAHYTYENDLLTAITTPTVTYSFSYGDFALQESVRIGSRILASYTYEEQNKYLLSLDFGNGDSVQYNYDQYGRLLYEVYEDGDTVTYQYDNDGALASVTDKASGITTRYYYDLTGRNVGYSETGNDLNHRVTYEYNSKNNLIQQVETIGTDKRTTAFTYDDDNRTTEITTNGTTVAYTYDGFGRVTQQVTKVGETVILTEYFTYTASSSTTTSGQVATYRTVSAKIDVTYSYTYDANGNITSVHDGTNWIYYTYDSANQLIREDNQDRNKTYTWTYDNAGNILSFNTYAYTRGTTGTAQSSVPYAYADEAWGDLLTSYNNNPVSYDEIGNPASLNGRSYTWEHGRRLKSMTMNGVTWTYTYNNAGLRTGRVGTKTVNGETVTTDTYEYIYNGSQLVRMIKNGEIVDITYDAAGTPLTMTYDEVTYYYITNLQGDVVGLLDGSGKRMITYRYTAYGQGFIFSDESSMTMTLANMNPLGYRGYVMDVGTFLCYCQSRYYDQTVGRFLNADGLVSTGQGILGNNMFAYCQNSPVMFVDTSGYIIEPAEDATDEEIEQYNRAIAYLMKSKTAVALIKLLDNSPMIITVSFVYDNQTKYNPQNNTIYFDMDSGLMVGNKKDVMSPAMCLIHEMGHAAQDLTGEMEQYDNDHYIIEMLNLNKVEIPIANELGEPTRKYYYDSFGPITMSNSTHYMLDSDWNIFTTCYWIANVVANRIWY